MTVMMSALAAALDSRLASTAQAQGKLNVMTTTEDLAAIAREVGGDRDHRRVDRDAAIRIRTSSRPSRASS